MKKILITGAGGFIGSHLIELCVEQGYTVKAFVRYKSDGSWGWLEDVNCKNDVEVIVGDIRDYDSVSNALKGCDTVFHLAALIGIPYSYISPLAYVKTNIEGTYNILEAAKQQSSLDKIIITSTSEVYGTAQYIPIDEKHPTVGQSPYSATKIAADHLALSYYCSFGLPVTIARPFNTYGPRQSARAIIPTIITQLLGSSEIIKLGFLAPKRDFTYVKDTCKGFLAIAKSGDSVGNEVNIASGIEISIGDLAKMIGSKINKGVRIELDNTRVRPDESEVMRLQGCNKKVRELTGWNPQVSLNEGLDYVIEWFKNNFHKRLYKTDIYNV